MGHATHFLERIERLSAPQADFALGLYRDPELLRFLLQHVRLPDGADRVALALVDREAGPFVVVSRDGDFVTCLGQGMRPGELPVVTPGQLEALHARGERLCARVAEMRERDPQPSRSLFAKLARCGQNLSRESFLDLVAWEPILHDQLVQVHIGALRALFEARGDAGLYLRNSDLPEARRGLRAHWDVAWSAAHATLVLSTNTRPLPEGADPWRDLAPFFTGAFFLLASAPMAFRAYCAAGRLGRRLVPLYRTRYRETASVYDLLDAALALGAVGIRHAKTRPAVARAVRRPAPEGSGIDVELLRAAVLGIGELLADLDRFLEKYVPPLVQNLPGAYLKSARDFPEMLPPGVERPEDVSPDLVAAFVANTNHDYIVDGDAQAAVITMTLLLAQHKPEWLYFPAAQMPRCVSHWHPELSLAMLRRYTDVLPGGPIRRGERPPRNAPCPCGSGKKAKRCCGGGAPAPAAPAEPSPR